MCSAKASPPVAQCSATSSFDACILPSNNPPLLFVREENERERGELNCILGSWLVWFMCGMGPEVNMSLVDQARTKQAPGQWTTALRRTTPVAVCSVALRAPPPSAEIFSGEPLLRGPISLCPRSPLRAPPLSAEIFFWTFNIDFSFSFSKRGRNRYLITWR